MTELIAAVRNAEPSRDAAEAQQQWVKDGTVTEAYVRAEVAGTFCNRTAIEDMVREALKERDPAERE